MKRSPVFFTILMSVTALAGCGAEPPPEAAARDVVRPALGFALDVPDGWTWKDLSGDVVLEMLPRTPDTETDEPSATKGEGEPAGAADADAPDDDARRRHRARTGPVIHVTVIDRQGMTLEAWADEAVAASQELQADLAVLSRKPTRLADGRQALALVLKNPRGLEPFVQRMRLTQTETRACAVIATAPESDWPAAEPAVQTCFDSFVAW